MTIAIILLGVALVLSLAFNLGFFGGHGQAASQGAAANTPARAEASGTNERALKAEADLDKKRKELEELKKTHNELKDELKAAKKKLFDAKEEAKDGSDLVKARAEVEEKASIQLEITRSELSHALAELAKIKADLDSGKGKRRERAERTEEKTDKPAEKVEVVKQVVVRELSDFEKERIARLEAQSSNDRKKAIELEKEVRHLKAKVEKQTRDFKLAHKEATLATDKFRAVEIRLNRTLLENDLLNRELHKLQKATGAELGRTVLTDEEIAKSDADMKEKFAAEDKAEAEARAKLEAAEARSLEEANAAAPATTESNGNETPATQPEAQA